MPQFLIRRVFDMSLEIKIVVDADTLAHAEQDVMEVTNLRDIMEDERHELNSIDELDYSTILTVSTEWLKFEDMMISRDLGEQEER